ncbi:Guanine nucleotide-binding protein G(t) subunit alpha-2 [Rhizoclosmatium sp. JEL0117]|nr:Guanine nucleotide-binding protein G(t) subunit alpha-2 [Rhizoclosmatium sp. JEL0117]
MGCATSKPEEGALEATTNSKVIDKELEVEQIERRKLVKLLLLGDSGKSTVLKQMKLIYNKGLTPEELLSYQNAILHNILECAQTLVLAMDSLHIPYSFDPNAPSNQSAEDMDPSPHQTISRRSATSTKHTVHSKPLPVIQESIIPQKRRDKTARRAEQEYMSLIESGTAQPPYTTLADEILTADDGGEYGFSKDTPFPAFLTAAIRTIWTDSGIQYCYSRRTEFQLPDACAYILNDIDRITDPGYVPTEEDILQTRVITLGVTETKLMVEGTPYRIFDFGGQRAERKKWAGYFEDVSTVLFLVALSAYDQVLYEDSRANRS